MKQSAGKMLAAASVLVVGPLAATAVAEVGPDSTINAVAGDHTRGWSGDGGPALVAALNQPRDSDVGPDGSLYIADTMNNRIRVVTPDGIIRNFAGNGSHTLATDPDVGDGGPATEADLNWPHDVMADSEGNVWIADSEHHRLRKVTPDGIIHTVAGNGKVGLSGDGKPATSSPMKNPKTVYRQGNKLYTAGLDNKVRVINLDTGIISRVAGTGTAGHVNGPAAQAQFSSPQRIQVDPTGNIYVADTDNSAIRRIDAETQNVTTILSTGLATPRGIALAGGQLYIADSNNHQIKKLDLSSGSVTTIAGGLSGFSGNGGAASAARFYQPRGLTAAPDGSLIVADTFNDQIRVISSDDTAPPPPPPPPPKELLTNNSVESSGSPFLGKYSSNDTVTWSTEAAQDGTHSIKMANLTSTASDTGLLRSTTVPSATGTTYTGSAWVKGVAGVKVGVRLQECPSSGCLTAVSVKVTLPDAEWHRVSTLYTSKQGAPLRYSVVAYALSPAAAVHADQFSLTEPEG